MVVVILLTSLIDGCRKESMSSREEVEDVVYVVKLPIRLRLRADTMAHWVYSRMHYYCKNAIFKRALI